MTISLSRKLLMPALLAALVAPLSVAANASPDHLPRHADQRNEARQALFERAGIDQQTRAELSEARTTYQASLSELRDQHRQRVDEILSEDDRAALKQAKQAMHDERRAAQHQARQERVNALFDKWQLSDATREALASQRDSFQARADALGEREFETPEARQQAWQELRQSHREALSEHLDDTQLHALRAALQPTDRGPHGPGPKGQGHHEHGPRDAAPMDN